MPHYQAKMSAEGQLTIPSAVRQHFDLKAGDIVQLSIPGLGVQTQKIVKYKA